MTALPNREPDGDPDGIPIRAYNDALTPVFLYMVPLILAALILMCFIKDQPLTATIQ